jgi:CheY-like chemotaxis protein
MPPQHRTPQTLVATPLALTATRLDALIVDADDGIRSVLRALLEGAGYSITDVKSWEEGRRYLRGHQGALVVLLDVSLPHPWDVALLQRALRRVLKRSAVPTRRRVLVLLSTNPTRALGPALGLALALGVPVVSKPFDIDDLLDAVTAVTRRLTGAPTLDNVPAPTGTPIHPLQATNSSSCTALA